MTNPLPRPPAVVSLIDPLHNVHVLPNTLPKYYCVTIRRQGDAGMVERLALVAAVAFTFVFALGALYALIPERDP